MIHIDKQHPETFRPGALDERLRIDLASAVGHRVDRYSLRRGMAPETLHHENRLSPPSSSGHKPFRTGI